MNYLVCCPTREGAETRNQSVACPPRERLGSTTVKSMVNAQDRVGMPTSGSGIHPSQYTAKEGSRLLRGYRRLD
jgi:hypothetical protein